MNKVTERSTAGVESQGRADVWTDATRESCGSQKRSTRIAFFGFYGRHNLATICLDSCCKEFVERSLEFAPLS